VISTWDEFDKLKSKSVEELTEIVAAAKREAVVAKQLTREIRNKLNLAEAEEGNKDRYYEAATRALAVAAEMQHEATHGKSISDEDRAAFEARWQADNAERDAKIMAERAVHNHQKETGIPA
jgi:hypothetical protein